jgi:PAS domain S-box-containing protein
VVSKPSQAAYQPFQDRLYTILGTMSFLMLGFTAFGYYASGNLSEPITDLLMKLKSAHAGDYTAHIDVARNDEFGDLARTFNDLKGALGEKDSSLNNERELFKLLVKDLPVGMLLLGPKGEYVDCNKALLGLFGLGEERLAGKTIFDSDWALWHEPMEDPKKAHPIMIAYATHQPIKNVPIEIAHSITGEKAWLTINAEPQISPDGGLKSLICTFVDVTEPRLLSESLSLARYSLDSAPDEIHWIASDGSFYFVNSATCAALGYTEEELLSMNVWDVDPSFTPDNWPARWKEFEEKRSAQFESKHIARDKAQYPVNVRIDHIEFQGKAYVCAFITNTAALKRVEQRLSAIEADFSAARQIAGIGNWSYDIENEQVQCSPEVNRIFGLDSGKGLTTYKGFMSLIHPEDRERVQRSMDDALSGKKRLDVDFRFKGVDGAVRYVHCEGDVVFDEAGKAGRIRGLIHDTTELRRVEAERDELDHRIGSERARLEAVLRNMPAGIVIAEAPSGKIRMVNQRMDDIFRHKFPLSSSIEDYGEWGVFQVDGRRLEPEDMPVARSIRLGEMVTGEEINFLRGDGTWGLLSMSSAPVCDNEGRVVDAIATFFDITESKKAENALVESKASLVKAHHIAHLGNWVWYIENNEMQYSDEMCQIYGILPQAYGATFESFLKLVLPDDRESVRRSITAALNRKEAHSIDFRIVRPDGRERIVHSEGEVVSDGLGKPIRMFGTIQDITDRKQVEGALREAKMQAELYLDLISHDINNMNQIGLGYLELAMQRLSLDEDGTALLSKPLDVLKNSSTLIDNVRKTRLAITGELKMRPVDVGEILESVKNGYDMIPQKDVSINYTPTKGSRVMANELLQDVMTNLIDNAIKHSGRPVNIGIGLEPAHAHGRDYYIISIEDDGPGIPDDNKSRIFERMIRGDTKAKGSGLGLYLVKTLVRSFNGKVWVENRIAGDYTKGSRFMIRLPAIKDQ